MELSFLYVNPYVGKETLVVDVPMETGGFAITDAFCPHRLQVGSAPMTPLVNHVHGEQIQEFNNDCHNILSYASNSTKSLFKDTLCDGLDAVVAAHISRCGRLIYNDLLIYIDCWAYLLYAHVNDRNFVEALYSMITKNLVEKYLPYIKEQFFLQPFATRNINRDVISKI